MMVSGFTGESVTPTIRAFFGGIWMLHRSWKSLQLHTSKLPSNPPAARYSPSSEVARQVKSVLLSVSRRRQWNALFASQMKTDMEDEIVAHMAPSRDHAWLKMESDSLSSAGGIAELSTRPSGWVSVALVIVDKKLNSLKL